MTKLHAGRSVGVAAVLCIGVACTASLVGAGIVSAGSIMNIATIVVPAATTVRVRQRCGHDASAGNSAYLDPDASLVAFETLDGTAAGESIARTSAATPLAKPPTR